MTGPDPRTCLSIGGTSSILFALPSFLPSLCCFRRPKPPRSKGRLPSCLPACLPDDWPTNAFEKRLNNGGGWAQSIWAQSRLSLSKYLLPTLLYNESTVHKGAYLILLLSTRALLHLGLNQMGGNSIYIYAFQHENVTCHLKQNFRRLDLTRMPKSTFSLEGFFTDWMDQAHWLSPTFGKSLNSKLWGRRHFVLLSQGCAKLALYDLS